MNILNIDLLRILVNGSGFVGLKFVRKIDSRKTQVVLLDNNTNAIIQGKKLKSFIYKDKETMVTIGKKQSSC